VTGLLLDTCAAIWLAEKEPISELAIDALNEALDNDLPIYVSIITSWEIGLLTAKKRLPLSMEPLAWFERLLEVPGVRLAETSARILVASSFLPGMPPKDPMDRIILATAREGGFRILTRDKRMLAYAEEGHVMALAC
jgi:PIN domain nuclease of toxin-antitoxin system